MLAKVNSFSSDQYILTLLTIPVAFSVLITGTWLDFHLTFFKISLAYNVAWIPLDFPLAFKDVSKMFTLLSSHFLLDSLWAYTWLSPAVHNTSPWSSHN